MAGYGIGTDHFGLATADLILIDSNNTPLPQSIEYAEDDDGVKVGQGQYDGAAAEAVECTYQLQSNTLNLNTLNLGYLLNGATHMCIERWEISTSNGEWPTLKASGYNNVTDYTNWPSFTLPSVTVSALKKAQGLDFVVGSNCRLQSSSMVAAGEIAYCLDDSGDVGAMGFSGATITISGEAVEIEGAITWTPDTGSSPAWIETQGPGASASNISWGTSGFAAERYITEDT